jgi:hypothetical protein
MLRWKTWIETRWRFWIGLALLTLSAASTVLMYPRVTELLSRMPELDVGGDFGRQIREAAELARSFRGYAWSQFFQKNALQLWMVFAILIGTGGLITPSGRGMLFTLSLPVSRNRLLAVRAGVGIAELFALAIVPALVIPALAPAVGESFGAGAALIHGVCLFVGGLVFFSLTVLLSTVFHDIWRPLLIALCFAFALGAAEQVSPELARFSVYRVMGAESYFHGMGLPWLGLLASATVSAGLLYAAARNLAQRDA